MSGDAFMQHKCLCATYGEWHTSLTRPVLQSQVGDKHTLHQLRKEIAIMKKVSYDANVVQFYGACTTEPAMLVMEYMEVRRLPGWRPV